MNSRSQGPRCYFLTGTGRCGTMLYSRLFSLSARSVCHHEKMIQHKSMVEFFRDRDLAGYIRDIQGIKSAVSEMASQNRILGISSGHGYFAIPLLHAVFGDEARFILATRRADEFIRSALARGFFDPAHPHGVEPLVPGPGSGMYSRWTTATPFEKCAWYWRLVNEYSLRALKNIPADQFRILPLEDVSVGSMKAVCGFLGLEDISSEQIDHMLRRRVNVSPDSDPHAEVNPYSRPIALRPSSEWNAREKEILETYTGDLQRILDGKGDLDHLQPLPEVMPLLEATSKTLPAFSPARSRESLSRKVSAIRLQFKEQLRKILRPPAGRAGLAYSNIKDIKRWGFLKEKHRHTPWHWGSNWVLEKAGVKPGQRLLDLGCVNNPYVVEFCRTHPGVEAVFLDIAPPPAEPLPPNVRYLRHDLTRKLPFEDGSFDAVISESSLEHLPVEGRQLCLQEACRVLKPSGRLALSIGYVLGLDTGEKVRLIAEHEFFTQRHCAVFMPVDLKRIWETLARGMSVPAVTPHNARFFPGFEGFSEEALLKERGILVDPYSNHPEVPALLQKAAALEFGVFFLKPGPGRQAAARSRS